MVDLPSYDAGELNEFQDSVPMPERARCSANGDREITVELETPASARKLPETPAFTARKPLECTQPISLASFSGSRAREPRHAEPPGVDTAAPGLPEAPAPSARVRPATGDVLCGRYTVIDQVDHYGMGIVYKARDRQRQLAGSPTPWVALKFARPVSDADTAAETSRLLRQEFLKLSQLNHPNIVKVYDLASDAGIEFIVMEWLSGETLASLLARSTARRLALDKSIEIVRCVARGLAHAHDAGVVHGDVKPSNIFLAHSRAVKLLDFGSSGTTGAEQLSGSDRERNWATRAYASPQVLEGDAPQPHDDVFALGVTAWYLLGGERPFGEFDALAARAEGLVPPPLPPDAYAQWPAVRRALQLEGINRPQHARLFLEEFDERGEESGGRRRHGSPTVAYGAVVATLLAAVVWFSVQSREVPMPEARPALDHAEAALAAGRLVEPEGDSAWSWYLAALDTDPGNARALDGLEDLAQRYVVRAREHAGTGDGAAARADLATARAILPGHFGIELVEELMTRQGRELLLRARYTAGTDMAHAQALLAAGERLLAGDDPELAQARDDLVRQRAESRVDALLREIDDRIISERLTVPRGDSAVDLLRQARALTPDDREVTLAADRIMTALLFQAMFAISNGDLDDAEGYLATARGMGLEHLALARAEYQLARARRAALSAP